MAPPPLRLLRAAIFAVVCVSLTLLAHVTAARAPVPAWAAVVGFGAVLGVAAALAGHERSLATIFGGLVGGQFALHVWFAAVQPPATAHLNHAHAAAAPAVPGDPASSTLGMTLAHVAAAAVSAWWLWRGERAAWSLARWVAALAARPLRRLAVLLLSAAPHARPVRVARTGATPVRRPSCALLRHTVVLRGPPSSSQASSEASTA
jgi:hypothetical protein